MNGFPLYLYRAKPIRVIDGDTVALLIDLGLHVHVESPCRLIGINAPELKVPTLEAGNAAKIWLINELRDLYDPNLYKRLWVQSASLDKYGRPLVKLWTTEPSNVDSWELSVNGRMVSAGHAVIAPASWK